MNSLYVYLGVFISGILIGGSTAYKITSWKADSDKLESVQRTIDQMVQMEQQNDEISTRFEKQADRIRTRYRTIYSTIATDTRTVSCVIPDEWVQQWNSANIGEEASNSSNDTLPTTTDTTSETNTERLVP